MKAIIFLLANISIIFFFSCDNEQTTENLKKYDINEILNDSNWIEITDTIDVKDQIKCLAQPLIQNKGLVFQSEQDYKELWEKSIMEYPDWIINCDGITQYDSSKVKYRSPNLNFKIRTVLGYSFCKGGIFQWTKHIYRNDKIKGCLFMVNVLMFDYDDVLSGYLGWASVPKIPDDYKIEFDTTLTYK